MTIREGKIFISYAHEDFDKSYKLYDELKKNDIDVWFDNEDLLPGARWEYEIRKNIQTASFFIAVISNNSVNKIGYVQKELKLGLEILREFPEN